MAARLDQMGGRVAVRHIQPAFVHGGAGRAGKHMARGRIGEAAFSKPLRPGEKPGVGHAAAPPCFQKGLCLLLMADQAHCSSGATSARMRPATSSADPDASTCRHRTGYAFSRACKATLIQRTSCVEGKRVDVPVDTTG